MTGLLLQLWSLTFLPRRGRCIVSLSCDRAVTFCYPDKCQLTSLGCKKAPSLPDRCCAALHTVFGQEEARHLPACAVFADFARRGGSCLLGREARLQAQVLPVLKRVAAPFMDHGSQHTMLQPGLKGVFAGMGGMQRACSPERGKNQCY